MNRWSRLVLRLPRGAFFRLVNALDAVATRFRSRRSRVRVSARDHRTRPLGRELVVDAYWIERPGEVGPAVSVFWSRQEVLRLDLFSSGAHIHYGQVQSLVRPFGGSARVHVPDEPIEARAERARFELANNLAYCLQTHPSRRARAVVGGLDPVALEAAAAWLHDEVLDLASVNGDRVAPSPRCP